MVIRTIEVLEDNRNFFGGLNESKELISGLDKEHFYTKRRNQAVFQHPVRSLLLGVSEIITKSINLMIANKQ